MIDDALWLAAVADLPYWCRARCYASTGIVELEFDRDTARNPRFDLRKIRDQFLFTLGGIWELVDTEQRFKSYVFRYHSV